MTSSTATDRGRSAIKVRRILLSSRGLAELYGAPGAWVRVRRRGASAAGIVRQEASPEEDISDG